MLPPTPTVSRYCAFQMLLVGALTLLILSLGKLSAKEIDHLRLQLGDILIVRSNGSLDLVGRTAPVEPQVLGFCYAGYLVRVRTPIAEIEPRYVSIALSTRHARDQIEIPIRSTVGLKNINAVQISDLRIPLPPHNEQSRIVAVSRS